MKKKKKWAKPRMEETKIYSLKLVGCVKSSTPSCGPISPGKPGDEYEGAAWWT